MAARRRTRRQPAPPPAADRLRELPDYPDPDGGAADDAAARAAPAAAAAPPRGRKGTLRIALRIGRRGDGARRMNDVFLTHAAVCLPNEPVSNDEMEAVLGMPTSSPSRARRTILRSNGITQRYYVIDKRSGKVTHTNAQLTAAAVRNLGAAGVPLGQMDLLVCGTTLPDQLMPNHALMVHGELGLPALEAVATSGICLAGMSALKYAWLAVRSGESRLAVTTGSDVASLAMRAQQYLPETEHQARDLEQRPELAFEKDFLRWMLSDGAGAWAMQARPRPEGRSLRIEWVELFSYANELPVCMYAGATKGADGRLTGWMAHTPDECRDQSVFAIKQDVRLLNQFIAPMTVGKPLAALKSRRGAGARAPGWGPPPA